MLVRARSRNQVEILGNTARPEQKFPCLAPIILERLLCFVIDTDSEFSFHQRNLGIDFISGNRAITLELTGEKNS